MSDPRWVYRYDQLDAAEARVGGDWEAVRGLMGGKGANLADMTRLGVPVPPGFTITTEACNAYVDANGTMPDGLWVEVLEAMTDLEAKTGKKYGDPENPLLVACRSGARISMPGMMDTVLDIGLNDEVVQGMVSQSGDARFVLDSYRRLIQMMGTVVLGVRDEPFEEVLAEHRKERGVANDSELTVVDLDAVVRKFKRIVEQRARTPFPADPYEQLRLAVTAVFESWQGKRARDYREAANIPHDLGTAVNVVAMVFGNTGSTSATGVAMSRDATTGDNRLEGDYLMNAQGEDVVAGTRPTERISQLAADMPEVAQEFADIAQRLEQHYRDMQDMEFTVERGKLWLLQTRTGKRTAQAAVRIAVEMANEGLISRKEAVHRVTPEQVEFFLHPQFSPEAAAATATIATGLNVSPGAASGAIALDPDLAERWAKEGRQVLLVRPETKPDDVHGMLSSVGILTSSGGRTSHAALVARQFGKPAVVGAAELVIDMKDRVVRVDDLEIREGEWVSIDGTNGEVYAGEVETVPPDLDDEWLSTLLDWADEYRTLGIRANADEAGDASKARSYGAAGIGLCRTEHMFFHPERLPIVQRMITAPSPSERREAVQALLPFQRDDFAGLFEAMDGLPVIIRLLDPPLHEFLPGRDELVHTVADLQIRLVNADSIDAVDSLVDELTATRSLLRQVSDLHESNPMLGLRGVRLGLRIPELTRMQARAVAEAAIEGIQEGRDPKPEIMVPLVGHASELAAQREVIEDEIAAVIEETGVDVSIPLGSMIEIPRAALTAGEIVEHAEFLSFGTNDLTQTTMAISRDDAEASFLLDYLTEGILETNPFATIDDTGVGRLMRIALEDARSKRPDIVSGVCGEHGGDPASIHLCHAMGISYVSCSPHRVPVARLAAAQAALVQGDD
jgi:pyruvate,orthophosphate dikinase